MWFRDPLHKPYDVFQLVLVSFLLSLLLNGRPSFPLTDPLMKEKPLYVSASVLGSNLNTLFKSVTCSSNVQNKCLFLYFYSARIHIK